MGYTFGIPEYALNGSSLVRLSDDALKCVVFLGSEFGDDIVLAGTGFLVVDGKAPNQTIYVVTASHVARGLDGAPIGVRLNTKDGGFRVQPIDRPDWVHHVDENVDVTALIFDPPAWADVTVYSTAFFATDGKMETKNFGPGDFAYVAGLYRILRDTRRNIPIVHTGHVAALVSDHPLPVTDPVSGLVRHAHGYLVESRAISGASGSPVFVRRSIKHNILDPDAPGKGLRAVTSGSVWLLGLWQASWPMEPDMNLIEGVNLPKDVKVPKVFESLIQLGFVS